MVQPVPETINFPLEEEKILLFWKEIDAFKECLKQSKGRPRYSFYDGPPFATGLPHYGHILAGSIKDVVTRYAHQNGYHVERRFGWDCHGLPVEYEIDKTLGIKGPDDVFKMGIDKYNSECRKIVMRYSGDWEKIVTRLGRWIDFEKDYKTMYPWFMESIWWIFSELWNKGLVYKGVKVMPFSTACSTPLSNFESGQNYKEVVDPAVVVTFPLKSNSQVSLLAWTTTPWTLPSNLALCVNPSHTYVKVEDTASKNHYILMEARLSYVFTNESSYTILERFPGSKLKGESYSPLFPYFAHLNSAFQVLTDTYVTEDSGTGVVHQAPYFGEDDNRVCLNAGVITKDQDPICPVDASGKFTLPVTHFIGLYVKDADKNIIKYLKKEGRLFSSGTVKHSYPFCWRSETPLIYKAVPSWFIRVQHLCKDLLATNQTTYWVPDFVKEKRFGNWLRDARDWAVSRNRYWGTPIPLWVSDDMEEIVCISSIKELEELSGTKVTDLHRESVDHLQIPSSRPGHPPLKRVPEVFDCWFESGSMPYAQLHYPFENFKDFDTRFPADFIAEGIDQTRGWFYTLLVISTALFNKAPFKNLIVNGLVIAADGQKMSKSKKNYPDPIEIVDKFGADALRLYLINSPVVRAENLRFKEEGVKDILKDVFLPWYNAYRFLIQNIERINSEEGQFTFNDDSVTSSNLMDQWILSFTQSLQSFVHKEMAAYRLYTVIPRLVNFIDNLTNWYVRMNRLRLKGEYGVADCKESLRTLGSVLCAMVRLMAPYTPFLTELMYQNLKILTNRKEKSIHFVLMPELRPSLINKKIEEAVQKMQSIIDLGRIIRDRRTIPVKYPLRELVVILNSQDNVNEVKPFEKYIMEELNVRSVKLTVDKAEYGVSLHAEPDYKVLGARLKGQFKAIMQGIKNLNDADIQKLQKEGEIKIMGEILKQEDLRIMFSFTGPRANELSEKYEPHSCNDVLVLIDIKPDETMQSEGTAREIVNRIQKLRKKAHLVPSDKIIIHYEINPCGSNLYDVAKEHSKFIEGMIKVPFREGFMTVNREIISETMQVKGAELKLLIEEDVNSKFLPCTSSQPFCRYVNICLHDLKPGIGVSGKAGSVLLENPVGKNMLTLENLKNEVKSLFSLENQNISIKKEDGSVLTENSLADLSGKLLYVLPKGTCNIPSVTSYSINSMISGYINIEFGNIKGTIVTNNPVGEIFNLSEEDILLRVSLILGLSKDRVKLGKEADNHYIVSQL